MRGAGLVGALLLAGAGGYVIGVMTTESKVRAEYEESSRAYRRAMEMTRHINLGDGLHEEFETNAVVQLREKDSVLILEEDSVTAWNPEDTDYKPETTNPYHTAVAALDTPFETFVSGDVNAYGISYIEEEEFYDEDGRNKLSVQFVMDAYHPTFFIDGEQIDDWDSRLGQSIVVDFNRLVPPGINPVLYVRNHKTDDDYEVTAERP